MENRKETKLTSGDRENVIRRVMGFRLLDDELMKAVFNKNGTAASLVLRIILNKPDLVVESVDIDEKVLNFIGRSISVDILARDNGIAYNIEIQRSDAGAIPKRARYHGSALDASELEKGATFDKLPETYVIFITENDIFGEGLPLYTIERTIKELGRDFDDKLHIIYANGRYRGDDDMGRLMRDFSCTNADDIYYTELAERVRYFKETEEGLESMSRTVEEYGDEREAKGIERLGALMTKLFEQNRIDDAKKASSDAEYRERLFKEFGIA